MPGPRTTSAQEVPPPDADAGCGLGWLLELALGAEVASVRGSGCSAAEPEVKAALGVEVDMGEHGARCVELVV